MFSRENGWHHDVYFDNQLTFKPCGYTFLLAPLTAIPYHAVSITHFSSQLTTYVFPNAILNSVPEHGQTLSWIRRRVIKLHLHLRVLSNSRAPRRQGR